MYDPGFGNLAVLPLPGPLLNIYQNEQESQRAIRLRNNKRRNRQKQKDYTSSLETKLRELQSQGVQATQEVQLSARKVVEDNARLKALLRHVGVEDHVIETWKLPATNESPKKLSNYGEERTIISNREVKRATRSQFLWLTQIGPTNRRGFYSINHHLDPNHGASHFAVRANLI
jgi:hypothetical protein